MAQYIYRRHTAHTRTLAGWVYKATDQFELVVPDGSLVDWPLLDDEETARIDCGEFNRYLDDNEGISEALWQARMAGDLEA